MFAWRVSARERTRIARREFVKCRFYTNLWNIFISAHRRRRGSKHSAETQAEQTLANDFKQFTVFREFKIGTHSAATLPRERAAAVRRRTNKKWFSGGGVEGGFVRMKNYCYRIRTGVRARMASTSINLQIHTHRFSCAGEHIASTARWGCATFAGRMAAPRYVVRVYIWIMAVYTT